MISSIVQSVLLKNFRDLALLVPNVQTETSIWLELKTTFLTDGEANRIETTNVQNNNNIF